ncbi:cardiolipin synthase [Paenibacillus sedimenti]|uniref:Cardiolipin synthase n=1 Tax=Paenibacillus sedimenti TaxID=2770274 RepID=A0A926KS32_9BACL|nr:cardiolipin synthase [Paenibacillus sedimenti]MBD0381035.1 cardiolipin synthase [Paenibacillus sedimenti]
MLWIILTLLLLISQAAIVLINEYCRPQKAVAWLVILYIFPLIGFLLYYFVAKEYSCFYPVRHKDNRILEHLKEKLADRCKIRLPIDLADQPIHQDEGLHAILKNGNSLPITACNETTVYIEGEKAFDAMFESISLAKHHIHIEFYIIRDDNLGTRFQQLLIQKAQEGVEVRLLYDGIGCRKLGKTFLEGLHNAGVETGCFFPLLSTFIDKRINYRNHRKIVVVDGEVGFIGGLNIGDEYLGNNSEIGYWRDTHFKIKGDAVLWIQYTFSTDWYEVKQQLLTAPEYYPVQESQGNEFVQIVKSGPDETILELIFSLIVSAKKRIYIETPYFVPDPSVLLALKTAAIRGVDVRIIIPAVPDSKLVYLASLSYVRELLQAGIRFYRYQKGFIHAKVIISDDVACSGSTNMDMRSFTGQFEINAVFFDGKIVDRLLKEFNRDLGESEEVLLTEFEKWRKFQKMKEVFARLLSPLF